MVRCPRRCSLSRLRQVPQQILKPMVRHVTNFALSVEKKQADKSAGRTEFLSQRTLCNTSASAFPSHEPAARKCASGARDRNPPFNVNASVSARCCRREKFRASIATAKSTCAWHGQLKVQHFFRRRVRLNVCAFENRAIHRTMRAASAEIIDLLFRVPMSSQRRRFRAATIRAYTRLHFPHFLCLNDQGVSP